jgi:hypothetical protein
MGLLVLNQMTTVLCGALLAAGIVLHLILNANWIKANYFGR